MIVTVKLFAASKDAVGQDTVELEFDSPPTVGAVRERLVQSFPDLGPLLGHARIALNAEYVNDSTATNEGDELAVIPPVSGG